MNIRQIIQLIEQEKFVDAIVELKKKLRRSPADIKLLNMLGFLYIRKKNISEGLSCFEKSLQIKTNQVEVLSNIVSAYQNTKQIEKAINIIENNINICSDQLIFKLGYFYNYINKFNKAIECYLELINSKEIDQKILYYNLAISYENNSFIQKSIDAYKKCLEIDHNFFQARFNLSILYLYTNNFESGWEYFESRLKFHENKIKTSFSRLENLNILNKKILIIFEYGIGDQLLFSTLLASLDLKRNDYFVKIDPRLIKFIKNKYPEIYIYETKHEKIIDYFIPIGSLGAYLRPSLESFKNVNYQINWNLDNNDIKKKLPKGKILCGISWKSSNKELGKFKSLNFKTILNKINIKNVCFINLQYNSSEKEIEDIRNDDRNEVIDFNFDLFNNIEQLADLIVCCDFIITISNVTAHLAGTLNKPAFVIPPKTHGKLWYWGNTEERKSIWYKSITIIENNLNTTEDELVNQINKNLRNYDFKKS